jgi:AraC-like DNA-binding protein
MLILNVKTAFNPSKNDLTDLKIRKAKKYINDNLGVMLTCKDVANYCNYNEIYLNRIFKKSTGESIIRYIHRKKSETARQYLKETDIKIKEISKILGFENEYHFSSFFKKEVGVSPSQYRLYVSNE